MKLIRMEATNESNEIIYSIAFKEEYLENKRLDAIGVALERFVQGIQEVGQTVKKVNVNSGETSPTVDGGISL